MDAHNCAEQASYHARKEIWFSVKLRKSSQKRGMHRKPDRPFKRK